METNNSNSKLPLDCKIMQYLLIHKEITNSKLLNNKKFFNGNIFSALKNANALKKEKRGGGEVWIVQKINVLEDYFKYYCPNEKIIPCRGERYNLIHATRNSKSSKRESFRLVFLKSLVPFQINGEKLVCDKPLGKQLNHMIVDKICFVENLENFMANTHLIQKGYTLLHPMGRIGRSLLERIEASEVIHFGDLDYVGLNEYARIKTVFPKTKLYIPENYFTDALKFGDSIETKQKASNALLKFAEEDINVKKILNFLYRHNLYLEQEGYSE